MSTTQELQALIHEENQRHSQRMAELIREEKALQSVLNDQQTYFTDLITRVTNLRVAKGEYMAAQTMGAVKELKFHTGNAITDDILNFIQRQARDDGLNVPSLLDKLNEASAEGIAIQNGQCVLNSNTARATSIAVVTRPDVRGVRGWGVRHCKECAKCAARYSKAEEGQPYQYSSKALGLAASPDLTRIPNKKFHRLLARILMERNLASRAEERSIDIVRVNLLINVQNKSDGSPLADASAKSAELTNLLNKWMQKCIKSIQDNVRTKAAWNQEGTQNAELSAAVDMLLYSIVPVVAVQPVALKPAHPGAPPPPGTHLRVSIHLTAPLQISVIDPLVKLLQVPTHREYLAQYMWAPLSSWLGAAVGVEEMLRDKTDIGMRFIDGLYQIYHQVSAQQQQGPAKARTMDKVFNILRTLAAYGSTLAMDVAVPSFIEDLKSVGAAKRLAIHFSKSLLRNVVTPTPLVLPPQTDPEALDLNIRFLRVPTGFMEILNNRFSSNERLPSTSRASVLDMLVTPKTKISVALKLYSELVIEVYRPYSKVSGVVLASSDTSNVPHCVPVIDLPIDVAKANVELNQTACKYMEKLKEMEQKESAIEQSEKLEKGKETAKKLLSETENSMTWKELKAEIESVQLKVDHVVNSRLDVALPFGLSMMDAKDTSRPILYAHVEVI